MVPKFVPQLFQTPRLGLADTFELDIFRFVKILMPVTSARLQEMVFVTIQNFRIICFENQTYGVLGGVGIFEWGR